MDEYEAERIAREACNELGRTLRSELAYEVDMLGRRLDELVDQVEDQRRRLQRVV